MNKHGAIPALALGLSLITTPSQTQNWSSFRGPNNSGIAAGQLPIVRDGEKRAVPH